jgi:cobalamin biosynthesis protein CobD/CbiB
MKSDLFEDINLVKEIYKKTSGICLMKDILSKNIGILLLAISFIILCILFVFLQYCYRDNIFISFVIIAIFLTINFVILCSMNKIIDCHTKKELDIDKKTKNDSFHSAYLLFINSLRNTGISIDKLEIIVEQLVLQNKNNKIYHSKFVIFFSGILVFIFRDFIRKILSDFTKETSYEFLVTIMIIVFGILLITVFDILYFLFNREKYIHDGIVRKLKQYVNCRKYEMLE